MLARSASSGPEDVHRHGELVLARGRVLHQKLGHAPVLGGQGQHEDEDKDEDEDEDKDEDEDEDEDEDDYLEGEASAEVFGIIDRADIDRAEVAGIPAGWRLQRGWRGQEGERLGLQARGHLVGLGGPEVI